MDIIHANLTVADIDRSVAFYTEQLGFEETKGFETGGTVHRFVAADNGVELQLSEDEDDTAVDPGDELRHVAVEVEDVDAAFERIDHHGAAREPSGGHMGARNAFIEDPDGYTIELVEWVEE